jgi:hypothetical protein
MNKQELRDLLWFSNKHNLNQKSVIEVIELWFNDLVDIYKSNEL